MPNRCLLRYSSSPWRISVPTTSTPTGPRSTAASCSPAPLVATRTCSPMPRPGHCPGYRPRSGWRSPAVRPASVNGGRQRLARRVSWLSPAPTPTWPTPCGVTRTVLARTAGAAIYSASSRSTSTVGQTDTAIPRGTTPVGMKTAVSLCTVAPTMSSTCPDIALAPKK